MTSSGSFHVNVTRLNRSIESLSARGGSGPSVETKNGLSFSLSEREKGDNHTKVIKIQIIFCSNFLK